MCSVRRFVLFSVAMFVVVPLSGCATALSSRTQTGVELESSVNELVTCASPLGVASFVEPTGELLGVLREVGLTSPMPVVKLLMQQSGCFQVVERGAAAEAIARERELSRAGDLTTTIAAGQMIAADFVITPNILFQDQDAGGGGLGALLLNSLTSSIVGGAIRSQTLEAQTTLTATSVATGLNVAIVTGSARKKDTSFLLGAGFLGSSAAGVGVGGSYMSTDIGLVTMAAFVDAHNKLVQRLGAITEASRQN